MPLKQLPSSEHFVVRRLSPKDPAGALDKLRECGTLDAVPGSDLFMLRIRQPEEDPKEAWRKVSACLPPGYWVSPVLIDERGQWHLPTGELSVRFRKEPSPTELKGFAESCHLVLRSRNEFVRSQAVFKIDQPEDRYLPEVVNEIQAEPAVELAWSNTLSQYKRA
jgi:hypothetical protein